jgi:hypothetical protein
MSNIDTLFNTYIDYVFSEKKEAFDTSIIPHKEVVTDIMNILQPYKEYYQFYKKGNGVESVLKMGKGSHFNAQISTLFELMKKILFVHKNVANITAGSIKLGEDYNMVVEYYEALYSSMESLSEKLKIMTMLKYMLYVIFTREDKLQIHTIIEEHELSGAESKSIEIIEAINESVDFSSLEKLYKSQGKTNGMVDDIYNLLISSESVDENVLTLQDKLDILFERKILIPITDDFLRYHKNDEIYTETNGGTKLQYIINKTNNVMDYYKHKNRKNFYKTLDHKNATLYNLIEEITIRNKMSVVINKTTSQVDNLNQLNELRKYAYHNFNDLEKNGFKYKPGFRTVHTIDALRKVNVTSLLEHEYAHRHVLDWRSVNDKVDIVGVALPRKFLNPSWQMKDIIKNLKELQGGDKVMGSLMGLYHLIHDERMFENVYYWLFNREKDVNNKYNQFDSFEQDEYYKLLLSYIYDNLTKLTYKTLLKKVNNEYDDVDNYRKILEFLNLNEKQLIPLPETKKHALFKHVLYNKMKVYKDEYDDRMDVIPKNLRPLEKGVNVIKQNRNRTEIKANSVVNIGNYNYCNAQCQHLITWQNIEKLRRNNPMTFTNKLHAFVREFVIENHKKEFICKSCSELVPLKRYISDWTTTTDMGINFTLSLRTSLETIAEYSKYSLAIKNMEKLIERLGGSIGLTYLSVPNESGKFKRQELIQIIITMLETQYGVLKTYNNNEWKENKEAIEKAYGIQSQFNQFFMFELTNDIFMFSSKEIDKHKRLKVNNITAYTMLILLGDITVDVIKNFPSDKFVNYYVFNKLGFSLFEGLYIRANNSNDITALKNHKLLCYVIFVLAGLSHKYKLWFINQYEDAKNNLAIIKGVVHTTVALLNVILDYSVNNTNYTYDHFYRKFFKNLSGIYSGKCAESTLLYLDELSKDKIVVTGANKVIFRADPNRSHILRPYTEPIEHNTLELPSLRGTKPLTKDKEIDVTDKNRKKVVVEKPNKFKEIIPNKRADDLFKLPKVDSIFNYVESVVGKWEKIINNSGDINLRNNMYIISHDINGTPLKTPITIRDDEKKVSLGKNNEFFGCDVYYTSINKITYYYNSQTYSYLGYKDNKGYVKVNNSGQYMKLEYSIKFKLINMGYSNLTYVIPNGMDIMDFIYEITKERYLFLHNLMGTVKRAVYQLNTKKAANINDNISKMYNGRIKEVKIPYVGFFQAKSAHTLSGLSVKRFGDEKITTDNNTLFVGNLIKLENDDKILLKYIIDTLDGLIEENGDYRLMMTMFVIDLINREFDAGIKREINMLDTGVRNFAQFKSLLFEKVQVHEIDVYDGYTEDEIAAIKEQEYSAKQAMESIDVDTFDDGGDDEGDENYLGQKFEAYKTEDER